MATRRPKLRWLQTSRVYEESRVTEHAACFQRNWHYLSWEEVGLQRKDIDQSEIAEMHLCYKHKDLWGTKNKGRSLLELTLSPVSIKMLSRVGTNLAFRKVEELPGRLGTVTLKC